MVQKIERAPTILGKAVSFEKALDELRDAEIKLRGDESRADRAAEEARKLANAARETYKGACEAYTRVITLRYVKLCEILEERGLGICSVEYLPGEFDDGEAGLGIHRGKEGQEEKLGIFPKADLAYFYCAQEAANTGTYATGSYRKELFVQLCPDHMDMLQLQSLPEGGVVIPYPGRLYLKPFVASRVEVRNGKFVLAVNGETVEARIEPDFREGHYQLFGLPEIPRVWQSSFLNL